MTTVPDYHTPIVGAGFSGIGAAIKLDQAGLTDYLLIEAGDGVGGT
jgi:cation diffusion facilitator CzcD-associated flavoprotein CzcO